MVMTVIKLCGSLFFLALLAAIVPGSRVAAAAPPQSAAAQPAPSAAAPTYATAEEAVTALIDAVRSGKPDQIEKVLGPGSEGVVNSGDPYADAEAGKRFVAAYDEQHKLIVAGSDRTALQVGKNDWPLPIPIVQAEGRWHFDAPAGAQELIDQRIGRNEIAAIRTSVACVDAQKAFFELAKEVEGRGLYAQRLVSLPGRHDGLYWPSEEGEPESPLAPLMAQAVEEGYPGERVSGKRVPYHGYFFRILTAQGSSAPDGAHSYISNGQMTSGFALIAWPAIYGTSGIMSFVINQDGIVFQKDLGPYTAGIAVAMRLFNPDLSWARVEIVE
jgi:hypothetical protein